MRFSFEFAVEKCCAFPGIKISAGLMTYVHTQRAMCVSFFVPASDRWWENAGSLCSGSYTQITSASRFIISSLWETNEKTVTANWADFLCQVMSGQLWWNRGWIRHHSDKICRLYLHAMIMSKRIPGKTEGDHRSSKGHTSAHHHESKITVCVQLPAQHSEQTHKISWDTHIATHWRNTQEYRMWDMRSLFVQKH